MQFVDGREIAVHTDWHPGQSLVRAEIDGVALVVRVQPIEAGLRIRHRGADLRVSVLPPRQAELAALMPVKAPPDTSRFLKSPMPGLIVAVAVEAGQEVKLGQELCILEAMKMENVLRAERDATVEEIKVTVRDTVAADQVLMTFA